MTRAVVVAAVAVAATVAAAAYGIASTSAVQGYDGRAHVAYAQTLRGAGRLPTPHDTYEYATPPAYPWLAMNAQRAADALGILADWRAGQALSALWLAVELALAFAVAREVAPERPWIATAAVVATAAIPIVLRLGVMFHPESQFAALALAALLLFVRASRRDWPLSAGAAIGVTLGLAALTRQTAAVVIFALGVTALCSRAFRFAAVAAVALAVVAGPWWVHQARVYGNPIQSNLERPGHMLHGGELRSFYVSAPVRDLVVHPYRPRFANRLLPQFYADLWSDWFGGQHHGWRSPSRAARVFASTQSVSALPLTLFALVAVLALGIPALRRVVSRKDRGADTALAAFLALTVLSWIAFVVEVVRFPQVGGDPIKSSYMLYLAPVFAVCAVMYAWDRGRAWRSFAALYLVSYVGFVATSW